MAINKTTFKINGLLKKANDAMLRRNYGLAIFSYLQALELDIDNNDVRQALRAVQVKNAQQNGKSGVKKIIAIVKATFHKVMKKFDRAVLDLEAGITADPKDPKMLLMLANMAMLAERPDIAIWQRQSFADTVAPNDTANLFALSDLYRQDGRAPEAIKCLDRVKKIDPTADVDGTMRQISAQVSSRIFEQGAKNGSRSIIKETESEEEKVEMDPSKIRTDDQRRKAIEWRMEHDLKERPNDYMIWMTIGDIAAKFTDFEAGYAEATAYYKKAQEAAPENSTIKDHVGDLEMRRFSLLITPVAEKAREGDDAAKVELKKLRTEEANYQLKEYQRRVRDQPLRADYHQKMGTLYMQFRKYDEAIGELQTSAKDPRTRITSLTLLGRCMIEQKSFDMAIKQFERAREGVEIFDRYKEPMYFEAVAYLQKGDKASAEKAFELFTELYETDIKFRDVKDKMLAAQNLLKKLSE